MQPRPALLFLESNSGACVQVHPLLHSQQRVCAATVRGHAPDVLGAGVLLKNKPVIGQELMGLPHLLPQNQKCLCRVTGIFKIVFFGTLAQRGLSRYCYKTPRRNSENAGLDRSKGCLYARNSQTLHSAEV